MLGIFQGKKAEYNKLILKSLVSGPKTTKQTAEYIYLNRGGALKPRKLNENEVKKIVSIISRKGSRLDELKAYHYIKRKNNLWDLTEKGVPVALTLFSNLTEVLPYVKTDLDMSGLANKLRMVFGIIFRNEDLPGKEEMAEMLNFGKSPQFIQTLRDCANGLIAQGVDLDKMSEKEFKAILMGKLVSLFSNLEIFKRIFGEATLEFWRDKP